MRIVPIRMWNPPATAIKSKGLVAPLQNPVLAKLMAARRSLLQESRNQDFSALERFALESRVLIVEGISGSGKDIFQTYLKKRLKGRIVYDYSEGEVLHSWKQLQIEGIASLRVQFLKLFVNYVKHVISIDDKAVFLLNRFHLSTYASTVFGHPKLEKDYEDIIKALKTLPIHIFILQLEDNEIEKRSLHPERSAAWQKFQQQIVDQHSFRERLERQQFLILKAAQRQQIPYSLIKLVDELEVVPGRSRVSKVPSISMRGARVNVAAATLEGKNLALPPLTKINRV